SFQLEKRHQSFSNVIRRAPSGACGVFDRHSIDKTLARCHPQHRPTRGRLAATQDVVALEDDDQVSDYEGLACHQYSVFRGCYCNFARKIVGQAPSRSWHFC
ncbi:MAG TPA: hypothetical protein VGJ12_15355, partial [Gemmatimonadaceae bacterium]